MRRRCDGDHAATAPAHRGVVGGVPRLDGRRGSGGEPLVLGRVRSSGPRRRPRRPAGDPGRRGGGPAKHPNFIRHLAHRALDRKPPTRFVRGLVVEGKGEHAGRLDIKHGGVAIVANLARYYAISVRSSETSTPARLEAALVAGAIDEEARGALDEAFRLLWQIRLEHQVRQVGGPTP
jgi:Putative nucleotidyltransferase substrate binding domain